MAMLISVYLWLCKNLSLLCIDVGFFKKKLYFFLQLLLYHQWENMEDKERRVGPNGGNLYSWSIKSLKIIKTLNTLGLKYKESQNNKVCKRTEAPVVKIKNICSHLEAFPGMMWFVLFI